MTARPRPRVLITHQGCIPIYRKGLYERLARFGEIDYVVASGPAPRGTDYIVAEPPFGFETLPITNSEIRVAGKPLIWQPLAKRYWRDFDAVVLGEEVKYVSHLALAAISKLKRRPIVWWGFGAPPPVAGEAQTRSGVRIADVVTRRLRKLADGYLCYTDAGARALVRQGFDPGAIAVLNNTVDIDFQRSLHGRVAHESEAEMRADLDLPANLPVLLYFGRFLPDKEVDVLIRYVQTRRASSRPVAAIIFGDGVEKQRLLALAAGAPDIVFRTHDDIALARALRLAKAIVIPGFVGLAITHGFAHGVPMITRAGGHAPEIDYLRHGENGLILPRDEAAFFGELDAFVASEDFQEKLSVGALAAARRLTMDSMAQRFHGLMRQLLLGPNAIASRAQDRMMASS